ncbi:thymidine kinase [Spiroplasma endosymbiont of Aspidapion aeneum]|uniref:thymidine kinase n=1 Tax=Spiroplasma endosymbiont of Aspidapion aeneum TaxID=3066276 RepID=UPI00313D6326
MNTIRNFNSTGWIELITGCMFAGKTEEFIKRIHRHKFAKNKTIVFKPLIDTRYSEKHIISHSGAKLECINVENSHKILDYYHKTVKKEPVKVVGIDEVQFLDEGIVDVIEMLANQGVIVIVNGLDKDFRSNPFKNVDKLLSSAEVVDKLLAVCFQCGADANRTQRIVNGVPAKSDEPTILISGNEKYEARCRKCYIRPE